MENGLKRFLSLAMAILMVFSNIPVSAFASEVETACTHEVQTVNTKAATCTEDGETITTCDGCGETLSTETITATGHNYVDGVCSACGESDPDASTAKNDEDEGNSSEDTSSEQTHVDGCTQPEGHEGDCVVEQEPEKECEPGCQLSEGHEGDCVVEQESEKECEPGCWLPEGHEGDCEPICDKDEYCVLLKGHEGDCLDSEGKILNETEVTAEDCDFTNATTDETGEGFVWDNANKTLTLSGAAITEAVVLPAGSTIVVTEGTENSITVENGNAVYSDGDLTINGTGKLTAKAEYAVVAPTVTITDTKVDLHGYYYGIQAKTTAGTADSVVTLNNVSGKIGAYGYGGIDAHSETANVTVKLNGCENLEIYNEVTTDSTSVNFKFAGIRAYTRGNGKDVLVELNGCENVSISNSTMAILAANNANAANEEAANVKVLIQNSNGITLSGNTSCYSAVFVNNYGVENDDSSNLVIENSAVEVNAPNATALMTSTKSAPSEVDVNNSNVTITAYLTGIRTIASSADYADTDVTGSTVTFTAMPDANLVDESVGTVVADEAYYDSTSTVNVPVTGVAMIGTKGYDTLAEAVAAANATEGGATIKLVDDVTLSEKLTIKQNITITGACTITRGIAGTIFAVDKNATLTLDGGVIIDGGNNWTFDSENYYADMAAGKTLSTGAKDSYSASEEGGIVSTAAMISINGALVMNKATIQNNWGSPLFAVPAGATLTMNEGTLVQHIRGQFVNALNGTWVINGGKITDVHAHNTNGGLVDMRGSSRFTINGGEICYVTVLGLNANGNGILAQVFGNSTKLTIGGGYIHDNASFSPGGGWGSVVYLNRGGDFEMNGGTITTTASDHCTAFVSNTSTSIVLNAGTIVVDESKAAKFDSLVYGNATIGAGMKIEGEGLAVLLGDAGNTFENNGTINCDIQLCYAEVTGKGTYNGDVTVKADDYFEFDGKVVISDGTWNGTFTIEEGASLSITGGTFKNDPSAWLAEGYKLEQLADGTYGVKEDPAYGNVAQVGDDYYETLADAVAAANAIEGGATITLLDNITLGEKLTITGNVTISGEKTITRADTYTGTLFTVNAGATLTLDGGLVVDGGNEWKMDMEAYQADLESFTKIAAADSAKYFTPEEGAPVASAFMIDNKGGTVNLNQVTIQNNYSVSSGVVNASTANSTVNLNGAKITHVAATQGNGVAVKAYGANINVVMNEGTVIDGNHVGGNHGIFMIYSGAVLTMNGGEVTNTTGWNSNGTVVGLYWGTFNMNGGKICSNTGLNGPSNGRCAAIYLHSGHTFNMTGGEICHNRGGSRGGVDASYSNGAVEISGGYIGENSSYYVEQGKGASYPADVNLPTNGTATISGGTYTQDVTKWLAPNVGMVYDEETGTFGITKDLYEYNGNTYKTLAEVVTFIKNSSASARDVKVLASHKPSQTTVIDVPMTLDLNGKNLLGVTGVNPIIRVLADVTVTGNGMIDSANQGDGYCFIVGSTEAAGNLTIENGTFKGTTTAVSVTKGKLTILDGDFRVKPYTDESGNSTYDFLINCIDANYKDGSAAIEVKGGVFTKFNPANNAAEGANTNFVAEGYMSVAEGENYTVMPDKDQMAPIVTITFKNAANGGKETTLKYPSNRFNSIQHLIGTNSYADFVLGADVNELLAYAADGVASDIVMTLHDDVVLEDTLVFYDKYFGVDAQYKLTLDLNGHSITVAETMSGKPAIRVLSDVTVTDGTATDGTIDATAGNNTYAFIVGTSNNAGTLTIADGTYKGRVSVISITEGTANISGGYFEATEYNGAHEFTLNCIDAAYNAGEAVYNITGGRFYKFNPENNAAEGAGTNFLKDGYVAEKKEENVWTVYDYVQYIKDELLSGNDVTLTHDVVITDYSYVNALKLPSNGNGKYDERHGNGAVFHVTKPGVELDLNGHSIIWDAHDDAYCNKRQVSLFMVTITGNANESSSLTVTDSVGTGKVDVYGMGTGMYVVGVDATGTIAGGTWTNYPCKTCGASNIFLYPSHGGQMHITGGTFEQKDSEYLLGWNGSSKETTNNGVGVDQDETKVIISGGTFVNFNPENVKFFDTAGGDQETINGCAEDFVSVDNGDGTYGVKPQIVVTFDDFTIVEGSELPEFTYTTNFSEVSEDGEMLVVGIPEVTVNGAGEYEITATASVFMSDKYTVKVVPGTLTVKAAVVRVYAANNAKVKYFTSLQEAMDYAVPQNDYVPIYLLDDITLAEPIVIADDRSNAMELQGSKIGGNTNKLISTFDEPMFKIEGGKLSIKNLIIDAKGDAFYVTGGELNLNYHSKGSQFIEVTSQTGNCVYVRGGNVNVNGAKLTSLGEYPAIQGNGGYEGNVTINKWNIGDGTYPVISAPNSDMAIYWPQNGKLTVEGGTITGDTALYAKSGTIVINGGEFTATGDKVDFAHNSNGASATGDAVVIEACVDAAYETPSVTITGGTFTSANAEAVMFYNCSESADAAEIMEISGGTYSNRVSSTWCAEGYLPVFADKKNVTTWSVQEATAVAAIGEEKYAKIQHAINDAVAGDEIDLVADVENQPIYVNVEVILDLNGHSYIQNLNKQMIVYTKKGGATYINPNAATSDNKGMICVMGGGLTVKDSVGTGKIESTVGNIFAIAKPLTIENGIFKVGTVAKDGSLARIIASKNAYTLGTQVNINGGEFYTTEGGKPFDIGFAADNKNDAVSIEKAWFSESIQNWIDAKNEKGFTYYQSEAKSTENVDGYLVTKGVLSVDGAWFGSWNDAESSIKKNSTIVLYGDVTNTYGGTVAKDFKFPGGGTITMDLNGHTFTSGMSEASKITTMTVLGNATLEIKDSVGGGKIVFENNSYPFVLAPKATLKIADGITFTGAMQWNMTNGVAGNLYIGETAVVGQNGNFKPNAATRIAMNESGDWTLSMGSLTMTADDATLANNSLTINKDRTIDLAGHNLTAKNVAAFGNLIDSKDGAGSVKASGEYYYTNHSNSDYFPLYDSANGCYRLYATTVKTRGVKVVNADTLKYGYTIYFNEADAYKFLAEMAEKNNFSMTVSWTGAESGFDYEFSDSLLLAFANKAYEQLTTKGKVTTSMSLNVNGLGALTAGDVIDAVPALEAEIGVIVKGALHQYTVS